MAAIQNIYSNAFLTASRYHRLPIWIRALKFQVQNLCFYHCTIWVNSNYLKLVVPNMHTFSQFLMFCKLHGILDKINKVKYDLPMQIKSLYVALFANFGHQSMELIPISQKSAHRQKHTDRTENSTSSAICGSLETNIIRVLWNIIHLFINYTIISITIFILWKYLVDKNYMYSSQCLIQL